MGNTINQGFNTVPSSYLKKVRQKTNKQLKEMTASRDHRSPSMVKREKESKVTELSK